MADHEHRVEAPDARAGPAGAAAAEPAWVAATQRPALGTRPKVLVAAALVALVAGAWWWSTREEWPAVGDRIEVTAEASAECLSLSISRDDLKMMSDGPVPEAWRGQAVPGTVVIDEQLPGDDLPGRRLAGTFVADDGTEVAVYGGTGTVFFPLGCGVWGA